MFERYFTIKHQLSAAENIAVIAVRTNPKY